MLFAKKNKPGGHVEEPKQNRFKNFFSRLLDCLPSRKREWSFCEPSFSSQKIKEKGRDFILLWRNSRRSAYAVFDGLGAHERSEEAALYAKQSLLNKLEKGLAPLETEAAIMEINKEIYAMNQARKKPDMATTIVLAFVEGNDVHVWNAGDSACYLFQKNGSGFYAKTLYTDHSYVAQLVLDGELSREQARHHPQRSLITSCLGLYKTPQVSYTLAHAPPGSVLLLASDGITNVVLLNEMLEIIQKNAGNAAKAGREIVALAQARTDEFTLFHSSNGETIPGTDDDRSLIIRVF